jgi:PAS domain S-box-containing protein
VVLENKNFRKDGTIVVLETSGVPRFTDDGRFIGYRGIDRDITDRKRAEEALRESEEKYRLLVDNIPFGITLIDVDHRIIISNAAQGQMFHTDSGLWPGRYCYREFEKRDTVCTHCPGTRAMATGICHDVETEGVRDDGTRFNARIHAIPLHNPEGRITGFIEIVEDITESKLAENALRESEKKYRHVLENMQDAYFRADRDGNLTMVNPSAVRMYGFGSADEMIGIPAASLYDNPEQREGLLRELKEKGVVTDLTGKGRRKDGTTFWASMNAQFIIDDDGRILGTEGIVRDISERRTMENAIHEVNRKLNLLNSITRHDVANQLTALRGYTQIAMIRKPEPVISDLLTKIDAAAETIASQIEFTKVYQEMGLKDPAWFRIEDVVSKAGYQQVKFSNTCRSNEIFADPMLERIFLNLFDNSIRHGEKVTEITVRCERAPGGLLIIVEDDGVGIPPEEKEKIFEKGFGKHTGFGLFLAKEVLSLTGITIRETGVFQNGARFEILVPKGLYRIVPQTIRPDQG